MRRRSPWQQPVGATCHTAAASRLRGRCIVDMPLADVGRTVVGIGSGFATKEWARHGWGAVVAYEAAGRWVRSWTQPLGLHSGGMFDSRPGGVARYGAGYEVVDR